MEVLFDSMGRKRDRGDSPDAQRVRMAISVMQRVINNRRNFDMGIWQQITRNYPMTSETQLHNCKTAACFAGWVAVSPEFRRDGGVAHPQNGAPCFLIDDQFVAGYQAIAIWLNIPELDAIALICSGSNSCSYSTFYGKYLWDIAPDHVIEKLQALL
ncbi:hypothetical protein [Nevskia ramosa]|uniref:hypothetical protein n=1 Tax=Nevskia ramosa TaxID=64002 RepID=UPI002352BFDD|nr:hypothetical protein [Nevskia ramosa]